MCKINDAQQGPCPDHPLLSGSALPALALRGAPSIGRSSSGASPAVTAAQPAASPNTTDSACDHRAIHDRAAPTKDDLQNLLTHIEVSETEVKITKAQVR